MLNGLPRSAPFTPLLSIWLLGSFWLLGSCSPSASDGGARPGPSSQSDLSSISTFSPDGTSPAPVTLQFLSPPDVAEVTVIIMGFDENQIEDDWAREGQRPKLYWLSPITPTGAELSFVVPLLPGLVYLAAVDQDGNVDVNQGDLVSAPVLYRLDEPAGVGVNFVVDRPFSPGPQPGGMDLAARPTTRGGKHRDVIVDTPLGLHWLRPRQLMVVGLPVREPESYENFGRKYPARIAPTFLWVGPQRPLRWPMSVEALVPDGLDVFVVLDLDRNGYPSTGDISSLCACDFERPPPGGAPLRFTLESVVPSNEQLADQFIFPDVDPPSEEGEDAAPEVEAND